MNRVNRDLQASHQILHLLEASKSRMDLVFDTLPGVFAVVDAAGTVFKGNLECAKVLHASAEELLGLSFSKVFRKESWSLFLAYAQKVTSQQVEHVQFELAMGDTLRKEAHYLWEIRRFEAGSQARVPLYSVVGMNISELRKAERQLAEIFASIPLGIFTVNRDGKVGGRYSTYLEWILGTDKIIGVGLKELLFAHSWDKLKADQREGVDNLMAVFGRDEIFYDVSKATFPHEVFLPILGVSRSGGRHVGVTYQPISFDGKVERLLVIVEDRTELVLAKIAEENVNMLNEQGIARIIQVKRCPEDILPLIVEEVKVLLSRAEGYCQDRQRREFGNILHGIKGNARIAGFEFLSSIVHSLESVIISGESGDETLDWNYVEGGFDSIKKEWDELNGLYRVLVLKEGTTAKQVETTPALGRLDDKTLKRIKQLFERYNALLSDGTNPDSALLAERIRLALLELTYVPLNTLEELMKLRASRTCKLLGKSVMIGFDWATIHMDESSRNALSEALLHVINNAISHGIEDPSLRVNAGKPAHGTVKISATESFGRVRVQIDDDGAGVAVEKVKSLGVKRRVITLEESLRMSKSQIMQLIFKPGFSTVETVDDVSGRGVGLDAVVAGLVPYQGKIHVEEGQICGTRFVIEMNTSKRAPVNRHCMSFKDFLSLLETAVAHTVPEEEIRFKSTVNTGILYADAQRMLLALTTLLGNYYRPGPVEILVEVDNLNKIHFHARFSGDGAVGQNADFSLPHRACEDFVEQHGGCVEIEKNAIDISFGYLLTSEQIPVVKIELSPSLATENLEKTMHRMSEAAHELNLNIEILPPERAADQEITLKVVDSIANKGENWVLPIGSPYKLVKKQLLSVAEHMMGVVEHHKKDH